MNGMRASFDPSTSSGQARLRAGIDDEEMYRVFNMGLGMVFAVAPADAQPLRTLVPEAIEVGAVVSVEADKPRVEWVT